MMNISTKAIDFVTHAEPTNSQTELLSFVARVASNFSVLGKRKQMNTGIERDAFGHLKSCAHENLPTRTPAELDVHLDGAGASCPISSEQAKTQKEPLASINVGDPEEWLDKELGRQWPSASTVSDYE